MKAQRHQISNAFENTDGKLFGSCRACDSTVRVYRVREYELKDGTVMTQYRCKNQMNKYQYRMKHMRPKRRINEVKQEVMQAIPSSLSIDIQKWEEHQGGHCALCAEYVRRGRGRGRDLYVVTDLQGNAIPGLYCWDCRNLLHQRITGVMEQAITNILSKERLRLTPPAGAGR